MACSQLTPGRTHFSLPPAAPKRSQTMCVRDPSRRGGAAARSPARERVRAIESSGSAPAQQKERKRCLRCGGMYLDEENHPNACEFHGHVTGEKGLFSLSPPHQGIDGEWSDKSGVIVYRWNDQGSRPNTGRGNWKKRWSCCQEREEQAPPCRRGWHVSYDDGYTLF
ncbi:hypothetical protein PR202_ga15451 [Eleusine coracana subsp. coracana]|uniref:Uncharacterized protein n=1 Tax=Eleusine coracana subsp. coracana TaxID=191504 RepID=A0AAV5CJ29_ELECO|nr:hypothetical protein QOZ80_6BG0492880 [Eleusine coracana subsp. coracana]GJM98437.1 hypothetical protein PR202_ga15451 [Eleusine coracana subsp. coracana]